MFTRAARPSSGSLIRVARPCRSRRWISWVIDGWAMPSAAASVVSRIGPSSLSLLSARAAVRLSAPGLLCAAL